MKVKIINKSKYSLPKYETPGSAGFDIRANIDEPIEIPAFSRCLIHTGLYFEIPIGYELRIQSRSGLALKNGIIVANTPGCVDSDYRGEVCVILLNLSSASYTVKPGDRIAQGIISPVYQAEFEEVTELSDTERGAGGFGHTGVN